MLSTTTFLLSKTFLLSQFSPPLQPMLSMIQVTRGHLRPYLTSFYQNFSPPLQPMLSTTTFLLSNTFLLSQFSPPLQPMLSMIHVTRGHLRPYLTSFYPNFCPLCSPCFQLQHSFYQKHSFYHNFPPLCSPCFQLHSFYQKHSFYQNFSPPSAAHAFNYNIPFIKHIPFIKISPPPSAAHAFNYIPFIKNIPSRRFLKYCTRHTSRTYTPGTSRSHREYCTCHTKSK